MVMEIMLQEIQKNGGHFANIGTNPYLAMHNVLIAHGLAVKVYRDKY